MYEWQEASSEDPANNCNQKASKSTSNNTTDLTPKKCKLIASPFLSGLDKITNKHHKHTLSHGYARI